MTAEDLYDLLEAATERFERRANAAPVWLAAGTEPGGHRQIERDYLAALAGAVAGEQAAREAEARREERDRLRLEVQKAGLEVVREYQEGARPTPGEVIGRLLGVIPE